MTLTPAWADPLGMMGDGCGDLGEKADHLPQVAFLSELLFLFYYFQNTVNSKCTKKKKKKRGEEHSGSQQENPEQLCNFSLSGAETGRYRTVIPVLVPFRALRSSSTRGRRIPKGEEETCRTAAEEKPKNKNREVCF